MAKKYEVDRVGDKLKVIQYIPEGKIDDPDCAYWILVDVLGKFLLLCMGGHTTYDYPVLKKKQSEMRAQLMYKGIFHICNLTWSERLYSYRDSLILNLLMYVSPFDPNDLSLPGGLRNQLKVITGKSNKANAQYGRNVDDFFARLLPRYIIWYNYYSDNLKKDQLIKPISTLVFPQMIYKKNTGFATILNVRKGNGMNLLCLSAAGYEWDEKEGCSRLTNHPNGEKVIAF